MKYRMKNIYIPSEPQHGGVFLISDVSGGRIRLKKLDIVLSKIKANPSLTC